MEKQEFYEIVEKFIVPLFTGSFLAGETESSARDLEVALGQHGVLLLKPAKSDNYRVVLKRGQPFKSFEVNLVKQIVNEFANIYSLNISDKLYLKNLQTMAIKKALIGSITESGTEAIFGVINALETWAMRTYEGATVSMGVLINLSTLSEGGNKVSFNDVITKDFFALFSDGTSSFVEFDKNGNMLGFVNLKKTKAVPTISPYYYNRVARICNDKRVGIVLTNEGDILVFYSRKLIFAKRNGAWCVYSHDEIIRLLYNNASYTAKEIRRAIYNTALDCSFAYRGACICYINKDRTEEALMHIDASDIISEEHFLIKKRLELEEAQKLYNIGSAHSIIEKFSLSYDEFLAKSKNVKTITIRKLVAGKKLFEIDRKLLLEMTAVDGATVIDYDGTIVAVGAIIKIEAGSSGGGRLAAATTMAKYGVAIKVSQDGIMQGFNVDKQGKVKQIFNIG